jgi:putative DNA primase/helicase
VTANLDAALRLAGAGLYVFPCSPATRSPLVGTIDQATRHPHSIERYWRHHPDALPAINAEKSGLVILDLDVGHKAGVDGVEAFDALIDEHGGDFPACPAVRSPRGGVHLFLRQPKERKLGNAKRGLPKGVDVIALTYVIGCGAVKLDGTFYEQIAGCPDLFEAFANGTIPEVPAWLVDIIQAPRPYEVSACGPQEAATISDNRARALGEGSLLYWANMVAATGEGDRNNALCRGTFALAGNSEACQISEADALAAMEWACTRNGYLASRDPSDGPGPFIKTFHKAWRDGLRKPLSPPRDRAVDTSLIQLPA